MNFARIKKIAKKIQIDKTAIDHARILMDAEAALENSKKVKLAKTRPNIRRIVTRSRIAKISVAAAIIIAVSFLQIAHNHDNQTTNHIEARIKTPAEMLTLVSINAAYHKGGLEAVEKDYERVHEKMVPWPKKVTISELFKELNGS